MGIFDTDNAHVRELGPGTGAIEKLSLGIFISSKAGSEIEGVPASDIKPTTFPFSKSLKIFETLLFSLSLLKVINLFVIPYFCKTFDDLSELSTRMYSQSLKTLIALRVISSMFPMGVEMMYSFPFIIELISCLLNYSVLFNII